LSCSQNPFPPDIDQWTHFRRDASNNAVAKDKKIGPPRHLQWKAGPGSAKTEEIIVHDGMLLAAVGDPNVLTDAVSKVDGFWQIEARDAKQVRRQILAYDLESGEEAWRVDDDTTAGYTGLSLTAHQDQVLIYGQGGLEFMDLHGDNHRGNLWTRGICQYGVMPANAHRGTVRS